MANSELTKTDDLNAELEVALGRRAQDGVLDIKCHVDVTGATKPADFKSALLNVFRQDEAGGVAQVPLSSVRSLDELYRRLTLG